MKLYYSTYNSPIGKLHFVASETAIHILEFEKSWPRRKKALAETKLIQQKNTVIKNCIEELKEYFAGQRKNFKTKIYLQSSDFNLKAWSALKKIPYGKSINYQEQAIAIGSPKAARAVGSANGKNPIVILIPCHRVIGKNKKLCGFAGGLDVKEKLLKLEQTNN